MNEKWAWANLLPSKYGEEVRKIGAKQNRGGINPWTRDECFSKVRLDSLPNFWQRDRKLTRILSILFFRLNERNLTQLLFKKAFEVHSCTSLSFIQHPLR